MMSRIFKTAEAALAVILAFAASACEPDVKEPARTPVMKFVKINAGYDYAIVETSYAFTAEFWLQISEDETAPDAQTIMNNGVKITETKYKVKGLKPSTVYWAHAVPVGVEGNYGAVVSMKFITTSTDDAWTKGNGLPELADMTLCYGGSGHRPHLKWDKERFAPHVTYVDPEGNESWLFESFLAIEFIDTTPDPDVAYSADPSDWRVAAGKEDWNNLLDYWFEDGYQLDALEETIEDARNRIGNPKCKRMVILTLPDPVIHYNFAVESSSTKYWGSINGQQLDFSKAADRIAAEKWYIDEARRRFAAKNYKNIELLGFYIVSEDLGSVVDGVSYGWSHEFKLYPEYLPQTANYIHEGNEGLYWIPYFNAGGYQLVDYYHIDMAIMQPNYYWKKPADRLAEAAKIINKNNLGMELEFDELVLNTLPEKGYYIDASELPWSEAKARKYRENIRAYMSMAKSQKIYGNKPFAMYSGDDAFYLLSISNVPEEQQLFHEICQFILNNPIKKY